MATKKKTVRVTRKFLNELADKIYDPKTKKYLRLCNGVLQNGPDPTNKRRPMHCGLGELYFAMTGRHPDTDHVSENDVLDRAVELSPLRSEATRNRSAAVKAIKSMRLPEAAKAELLNATDALDDRDLSGEWEFRNILDDIPNENDLDGCSDHECTVKVFRDRSRRVASKLREAAKLLPE